MSDIRLQSIIIVGGGTAGWMAAASLARKFASNRHTKITLVDSAQIGTIGVGEATVPSIRPWLDSLKINEIDFIKRCNATFKLAIGFDGWAGEGSHFFHPFAEHGVPILGVGFHHLWTKLYHCGRAQPIDAYCLGSQLAEKNRFALPRKDERGEFLFNYAYHFDAALVAAYLKSWSQTHGVRHIDARIEAVEQNGETGDVTQLLLEGGQVLAGDFFIDCTGFQGLLIEKTLKTGYEDWRHWLPCDRAVAMPCESRLDPAPYTRSLACEAGWQWRIPLQHRVGNGYVFCSDYLDEDQAITELTRNLEGPPIAEPRMIPFVTGMRRDIWSHNVFALGLASGFLEPLESTSIYMVQTSIQSLINNFPTRHDNPYLRKEVNRRNREHQEHLRDFIILHYALNKRVGQPFWDRCRTMALPDSLAGQIELFRHTGRIQAGANDFFRYSSWLSMFAGFGVVPQYYHPSADDISLDDLDREFGNMKTGIDRAVMGALSHRAFIAKNCAVATMAEATT
ncbi:tryptophan halogenase family protein [Candidatus Phycosocius spiralis]|uniref:Tryptophan halogenase n=1 Tax=Candidatus Phycosocius spiralis TaxID=2815099 RepID=A0ABQ4PVL4_9PROT|nr:tryptophan halogenase family protein [Candidatus Phycosocius spiralis]GIU67061.1 tryptophan halogenase [Candidatus Phycosocius spiralis]